ncbi:flagellin N-terminal helical domain-containing protein [Halomonas hibernica]|uniref:flagellin N-terminal helical domain-containing protein n=1 Tax=Halomonas hibernica TaxID=2591147 RepID=UPI0015533930|nr:flagellin [Halomonas hibernica]
MSVINTNITSMIGQSNLNKSQNALQTSMERLSSGLRINSAKDDAAGQAIANRMTAQITGLAQAQRNANDGISIAQTAEGSLNQINDNLQRIRELTVQAQNGTNSSSDLQSIQDEVNQRMNEINRISEETDFNGVKVLSEDISTIAIQVGANDGEAISVNLETINQNRLGLDGFDLTSTLRAVSAGDENFRTDNINFDDDFSDAAGVETIDTTETSAVEALGVVDSDGDAVTTFGEVQFGGSEVTGDAEILEFEGRFYAAITNDVDGVDETRIYAIEGFEEGSSSVNAVVSREVTGELALSAGERGSSFGFAGGAEGASYSVVTGTNDNGDAEYFVREVSANGDIGYSQLSEQDIADLSANSNGVVNIDVGGMTFDESEVGGYTLDPMKQLDDALSKVDSLRSELGAVQNRFEDAITNLDTNATNLSAARSRIEDADYAMEVADMTRAQILQQAGTSVLAQANQIPQNVLSLLG